MPAILLYTKNMQKIATKVFIVSSVIFGSIGILMTITGPSNHGEPSGINDLLTRLLGITVFVILPSFALSVAAKYLKKD